MITLLIAVIVMILLHVIVAMEQVVAAVIHVSVLLAKTLTYRCMFAEMYAEILGKSEFSGF